MTPDPAAELREAVVYADMSTRNVETILGLLDQAVVLSRETADAIEAALLAPQIASPLVLDALARLRAAKEQPAS